MMQTVFSVFPAYTPVESGIMYLLLLDCAWHMPIGCGMGFSRSECSVAPTMSGVIDIDCEVEFKDDLIAYKPMYMEDYMIQIVLFTTLRGLPIGDPLKTVRDVGKVVNGNMNPEFQIYLLFAMIAYHRYSEVPAQMALLREMAHADIDYFDWFVREAEKRMREIPKSEQREYESYYDAIDDTYDEDDEDDDDEYNEDDYEYDEEWEEDDEEWEDDDEEWEDDDDENDDED